MYKFKKFSELTITDDYMFCQVMQNERLCRKLLELVLRDRIGEIRSISYQDTRSASYEAKSVRLDVTVEDEEGNFYDIEMQTSDNPNLARRMRYYQAITDTEHLRKGMDYIRLPDCIIIMFCTFDHMGEGLPVYSFRYICMEDKSIVFPDGTLMVMVNSRAAEKEMDAELRDFLRLMNGETAEENFSREVAEEIQSIKADSEREAGYMSYWKLQADLMDARREGREEGEEMVMELLQYLLKDSRDNDIKRAISDRDYRNDLYKYYGIAEPNERYDTHIQHNDVI